EDAHQLFGGVNAALEFELDVAAVDHCHRLLVLAQLEALDLIAADIDLVIIVENLVEARALKDQRQLVTGAGKKLDLRGDQLLARPLHRQAF
ncbi:hypothetical protein, partial [Klebsiella aerogenes]|uniref:hypothetical protein n=1 Tax=Klebsiella aerogenes TaxID=548 RepID=UPI0013D7A4E1